MLAELNLKNREMSSSCVVGEYLYIGTYVDALFIFELSAFKTPSTGLLTAKHTVETTDSILTICSLTSDGKTVAIGQAGGFVDLVVDFEFKKDDGIVMKEAGYINKIIKCSYDEKNNTAEAFEIVMACERGIFLANYSAKTQKLHLMNEEKYLEDCLVS